MTASKPPLRSAWGKADAQSGVFHHLAHHSADVAAVFLALLDQPIFRARAEMALGRPLLRDETICLAALVFLHDIGKLAPGFQAKAWPAGHGIDLRGHLECGWYWSLGVTPQSLDGCATHLITWDNLATWFLAIFAHHGRPVPAPGEGGSRLGQSSLAFPILPYYNWKSEELAMGQVLRYWFPQISMAVPPAPEPEFLHFICGMITLADWIGSDRRAFPFEACLRNDYWLTSRSRAQARVEEIGLGPPPGFARQGRVGIDIFSSQSKASTGGPRSGQRR